MPITLGCPSCGKRFRARDESAGKKVKCPYCQAAVQVPAADEAAPAGAGIAPPPAPDSVPVPVPAPRPLPPPARPLPAHPAPKPVLASPDDWGALPAPSAPLPPFSPPQAPDPAPSAFPPLGAAGRGGKDRPKPARAENEEPAPKPAKGKAKGTTQQKTPAEILARGWRAVRRGLFWVQFALLWLSLIGFVGFGKAVYVRSGNELPKGDGADWVSIEGYINAPGPDAVPLSKPVLMDLALYGVPVLVAGSLLVFGRFVASGVPRNSGARGLYTFSALFGVVGFAALFVSGLFDLLLLKDMYKQIYVYTRSAFLLLVPLAEFWFLTALAASGVALKRPKSARAVGLVGFVFALAAFVAVLGWDLYVENWRPKKPNDDIKMYEQAALLLGWVLVVGVYGRAVRSVRVAAREFLDAVEDGRA